MSYAETRRTLQDYRNRIEGLRAEMRAIQAAVEPQPVGKYRFATPFGDVSLEDMFGDKTDLIVVHNMGTRCASCTMWADGFNGVYQHLSSRAAFVVVSNDPVDVQQRFAGDRGWRFPMVSSTATSFHTDMGYETTDEGVGPGISAFRRDGGQIVRVSDAYLGPRDDFSIVWHILDLFPESSDGFRPQFRYFGC